MNFKRDFRCGKRAGKKHPNSHDADMERIRHEESQNMNQKQNELQTRKAEVDQAIKKIEGQLDMINTFLKEAEGAG